MTHQQQKEVEAAIIGWCGYSEGGRVTKTRPDSFSGSAGKSDAIDHELWSYERVEAALKTFSPKPLVRSNMARLLKAIYWNPVGLGSYEPILRDATELMLTHVLHQIEANTKVA